MGFCLFVVLYVRFEGWCVEGGGVRARRYQGIKAGAGRRGGKSHQLLTRNNIFARTICEVFLRKKYAIFGREGWGTGGGGGGSGEMFHPRKQTAKTSRDVFVCFWTWHRKQPRNVFV